MGMYDTFANADHDIAVQLKVGRCVLAFYPEGTVVDRTEFPPGIYYGYEGVVVIRDSRVEGVERYIEDFWPDQLHGLDSFTKWGDPFDPKTQRLDDFSPVVAAVNEVEKRYRVVR